MEFYGFLLFVPSLIYGAVIELDAFDIGYVQGCDSFVFGTHQQRPFLGIQLFTTDFNLRDSNCKDTYGKCNKFCSQETFCALYCSPMCCVDRKHAEKACRARNYTYKHLSPKLKVLGAYWRSRSDRDVGVWVEDDMQLMDSSRNLTNIGRTNFTLQVVTALYLNSEDRPFDEIGFGRDPWRHNMVNVLHEKGIIDQPILSIGYPLIFDPRYRLGGYNTNDCYNDWQSMEVVGEHGWMFDAKAVAFLNYKSDVHDFRVMLSSDGIVRMPRHVFLSFSPNLLSRYQNEYNLYQLNDARRDEEFDFYLDINDEIRFPSDLDAVDVGITFAPNENVSLLQLQVLDPNPDNVEWILGRMILIDTCITLDFGKNKMYFAKARENNDDNDSDSEGDEDKEFQKKSKSHKIPHRRKANNVDRRGR